MGLVAVIAATRPTTCIFVGNRWFLFVGHQRLPGTDLNRAGPGMFSFWQAQGQHAISCAGLGTISIDGSRKGERLLELTGRETAPVNGCTFRYLDFGLPLQAQRILLGC